MGSLMCKDSDSCSFCGAVMKLDGPRVDQFIEEAFFDTITSYTFARN